MQQGLWAILLWPYLLSVSIPLDCGEEQGSLSRCPSISQEKLLDRVIQHAELIYRVSEESCSLFVSNSNHWLQNECLNLCTVWWKKTVPQILCVHKLLWIVDVACVYLYSHGRNWNSSHSVALDNRTNFHCAKKGMIQLESSIRKSITCKGNIFIC